MVHDIKFSVVIPSGNDHACTLMTAQALSMYFHPWIEEILILDNTKQPNAHSNTLAAWAKRAFKVRYVADCNVLGTQYAKNKAIELAVSDYVLCLDSHVMLFHGSMRALRNFYEYDPSFSGLVHGHLVYDDFVHGATHFDDVFPMDKQEDGTFKPAHMWGRWGYDKRVESEPWFDIPGSGMGCFATRKSTWLGFHPDCKGFGAEEMVIHGHYKKLGRATYCVSGLKWWHMFPNFGRGVSAQLYDKVRNLILGLQRYDNQEDISRAKAHFVGQGLVSEKDWQAALEGKTSPPSGMGCNGCSTPVSKYPSLDEWFLAAHKTPSDINRHLEFLAKLAGQCRTIVDIGDRPHCTLVAWEMGKPDSLYVVSEHQPAEMKLLESLKAGCSLQHLPGNALSADVPECDLLFLDTDPHSAEQLGKQLARLVSKVKKYIVLHDTQVYGEKYLGEKGMKYAIIDFLRANPEWFTAYHFNHNNGLTVLSCDPSAKPPGLPSKWGMALSYAKHKIQDTLAGGKRVSLEVYEQRKAICTSNGGRCPAEQHDIDNDRCHECGCFLNEFPGQGEKSGKAWMPHGKCNLGYWDEVVV